MWLEVFFALFALRSFFQLLKICVIKYCYRQRTPFEIIRLVLVDGLLVIWLIYGNKLYYSKENNCAENKRTQFLSELMGCILYVGYLMIFIYFLILCTVPCLFMYVRHIAMELNM